MHTLTIYRKNNFKLINLRKRKNGFECVRSWTYEEYV